MLSADAFSMKLLPALIMVVCLGLLAGCEASPRPSPAPQGPSSQGDASTRTTTFAAISSSEILALKRFAESSRGTAATEFACLAERMCSRGGPIGGEEGCDTMLAECMGGVAGAAVWSDPPAPDFICRALFNRLNEEQHAMLAAPTGCSITPPATAYLAALNANEAQCLIERVCDANAPNSESRGFCAERITACTQGMEFYSVERRAECRDIRMMFDDPNLFDRLIVGGSATPPRGCWLSSDPPLIRTAARQVQEPVSNNPAPAAMQQSTPPQTWQDQAERADAQSPPPQDEFDLGEFEAF